MQRVYRRRRMRGLVGGIIQVWGVWEGKKIHCRKKVVSVGEKKSSGRKEATFSSSKATNSPTMKVWIWRKQVLSHKIGLEKEKSGERKTKIV